ncbi:hypothetical protein V8E36_005931 [Tilletia maclaganii]
MRFSTALLAITAALLPVSSVWAIPGNAAAAAPFENVQGNAAPLRRGEIHDIMRTISRKGKCGTDFCSTFLHVQPKTRTITVTRTVTGTGKVPSSTVVRTTAITQTASSAVTRTQSKLSIVAVTPTVQQTVVDVVPFTSTVTTITSLVTSTATQFVS